MMAQRCWRRRRWIVLLAPLVTGLGACHQAPLSPEHGYPSEWPGMKALTKGCSELNGTWRNDGVVVAEDRSPSPITLASLIPQLEELGADATASMPVPASVGCVKLQILPGSKWYPFPTLRATVRESGHTRVYDVKSASDEGALLYVLEHSGGGFVVGMAGGQVRIFLTVANDESLIAKIHRDSAGMVLLIPFWSNEYQWARFERVTK